MSVVANVAINVDSRGATQKLREVQIGAKATEQAFNALTSAAAAFGAGFAISRVIQDVKELDKNLRRLGTVGGDVTALDKGLGQLSKNLDGVASKAELAAASYQALSAGFTETGANLKLVEAATKAAVGGLADTTQVTEVLTKTLNAYGLSGSQAIKVTDSISKAIEYGQVEWADYTSQLGRVASIAAIAGVSIDEVNAFVAAATKNGATAEIAFTGLGATLNSLLQPTKESQDAAAALGIQWNIAGLNAKGFDGLIAELAQKMGTNKEAAVRLLGSQEALRGAFAAASKNGKDFSAALASIQDATGKTDMDFQKMKGSVENTLKALDTAFANISEALFKAFGPTVVVIIGDLTKAINGFADVINAVPQPVLNTAGAVAKAVVQVLLLQKALQGILALRLALVGMFAATAASATTAATATSSLSMNMRYLQGSMATTQTQASGLVAVLRNLAAFGVITVGINLIVTGLQEAMAAAAETRRLRGERAAGGAAAIYGGSATAEQKKAAQKTLEAVRKEQQRYREPGTIAAQTLLGPASQLFGVPTTAQAGARRTVLMERAARAQGVLGLETRREATGLPTPIPTPQTPYGGGESGGAREKKDKAAEEEARMQARLRGLAIETNAIQKQLDIQNKITQAEIAGDQQLAIRLQGEERSSQIIAGLQSALVGITDQRERQALIAKTAKELDAAQAQTAGELAKFENAKTKAIEDVVAGLDMELLKLQANTDTQKQAIQFLEIENQLKSQGYKLTDADAKAIRSKIAEIQKLTKEQEAANAKLQMEKELFEGIAGTVAGAVNGAIDAAVKGTENLGDALKNLAADMLATIGKMLIIYGIAQALGAAGGNDGVGIFSFLAKGFGFKGAKDGAYWSGGFEAFADGGMVTKPTMGLIGEGGEAEYVIPASKMQGAMSRYSAGARGAAVIPGNGASGGGGTVGGGSGSIDVRYTVERINSVDYVTADQFQRGMAQAAKQGAEQGERRALSRLQNSPSVRRRVGV